MRRVHGLKNHEKLPNGKKSIKYERKMKRTLPHKIMGQVRRRYTYREGQNSHAKQWRQNITKNHVFT